jgi:hypothetical protein
MRKTSTESAGTIDHFGHALLIRAVLALTGEVKEFRTRAEAFLWLVRMEKSRTSGARHRSSSSSAILRSGAPRSLYSGLP